MTLFNPPKLWKDSLVILPLQDIPFQALGIFIGKVYKKLILGIFREKNMDIVDSLLAHTIPM